MSSGTLVITTGQQEDSGQKQTSEVVRKKSVFKSFAKFTGKHLCQSQFITNII